MTTQLVKTETRSRAGIKGTQTKCFRAIMQGFRDHAPKFSIFKYNRLLAYYERQEVRLNYKIEALKGYEEDYKKVLNNWRQSNRSVNRLLRICDEQKKEIGELKDRVYTVEFETYEAEDPDTCCICYDDIKINQHVHKCKSCSKCIHIQCKIRLTDTKCPMCRNDSL